MTLAKTLSNLVRSGPLLREAIQSGNVRVLSSLLGPAWRGLVQQHGKSADRTTMGLGYAAAFDWKYERADPDMKKLYEAAKT